MKSLIVAFLLFVFAIQGMGAASGINVLNASRAFAHPELQAVRADNTTAVSFKADPDLDDLKIFSIAEELSDYVALEPVLPSSRYQAPSHATAAWTPSFTILPQALPPPRA
ncbi:hypothetical protein Q8A64_17120 [Oxalobacteraceae bacterium R-40]|uniref:Uncharacterized protein n=1 Tax=Keguizhuia sedimenti TaxID=3064264 RepID=A0ABU1BSY3_9BURK|nr:hypothetical protein [Oxalobacteraceae bacterium R-40]